jgi:16S rRNA processing protein RimM
MGFVDNQARNSHARQPPEFLAVGRVVRPHGVRGQLLVEGFSEQISLIIPLATVFLGSDYRPSVVCSFRPHQNRFLLLLEGCEDRETAELWRGEVIHIRYEDVKPLPEHVYYHWQVLGLRVFTTDGECLGTVNQILETGANDVYMIHDEHGAELLLPAIESVIMNVDLENCRMVVNLIHGLRSDSSG